MKIHVVVGKLAIYEETLQWNVDAWMDEDKAGERVTQLEEQLSVAVNSDPSTFWNSKNVHISYTVKDLELVDLIDIKET